MVKVLKPQLVELALEPKPLISETIIMFIACGCHDLSRFQYRQLRASEPQCSWHCASIHSRHSRKDYTVN